MTTADSPNRIKDKQRIESTTILKEDGYPVSILSPKGSLLATGYTRIVYGDHGPYIELKPEYINRSQWKAGRPKSPVYAYYQECYPIDGSNVKLYVQIKDVKNLPNPPAGKYSTRNNRKEGYADYKVGMLYIDPDQVTVKTKI